MVEVLEKKQKTKNDEKHYNVLFVCTGNTCRSPMAQVIYNDFAKQLELENTAYSAGIAADGMSISRHAKAVLCENNLVDESFQRSSVMINSELCERADLIIGITEAHAMRLMMMFPSFATKIKALSEDVSDPFGGYIETYRKCFNQLSELIKRYFFPELL